MPRSFWMDALLVVVTLGLYAPYWLYERNTKLRDRHPGLGLADNLWWLAGGIVLSITGVWVAFGDPFWSVGIQMIAVVIFSIGVHVFASNAETVAHLDGRDWTIPAPFVSGLVAAAFLFVQAGNIFPSMVARAPAILLLLTLPFLFYRVWEEVDVLIPEPSPAVPAAPTS